MAAYNIACGYFPTTVMFVDDQKEYLDHISIDLDDNLAYKFYTDPLKATTFLKEHCQPIPYMKQWSRNLNRNDEIELGGSLEEKEHTHNYIDIDVAAIHQQIYSADRFKDVSLVVVDFAMPDMSGLQFCEQLKNLPIKKLMLTGQAGHELGVQALNDGIIDKFIVKGASDFDHQLNSIVEELQCQYFYDLSDTIIQNLAVSPYCCLDDNAFITLFNKLRKEHNIIEYYLVKDTGCFLLLDIEGNVSWLAVKSEQEMLYDYEITNDSEAPKELITALQQRKQLLFHINIDNLVDYFQANWQDYLYPATELQGEHGKIYYSFIKGVHKYDVNTNKIASYKDYLISL